MRRRQEASTIGASAAAAGDGRHAVQHENTGKDGVATLRSRTTIRQSLYRIACRVRDRPSLRGERFPWVLRDERGVLESDACGGSRCAEPKRGYPLSRRTNQHERDRRKRCERRAMSRACWAPGRVATQLQRVRVAADGDPGETFARDEAEAAQDARPRTRARSLAFREATHESADEDRRERASGR